jgi:hypothetical protein
MLTAYTSTKVLVMGVDLRVPIKGTPTGNLCRGALSC